MFLYHIPENLIQTYLDMAYTLISADGVLAPEEQQNLELYAVELNLPKLPECHIVNYNDVLPYFDNLSKQIKSEIYFELLALSYVDSDYDENERKLMEQVADYFNIDQFKQTKLESIVVNIMKQYELLGETINE